MRFASLLLFYLISVPTFSQPPNVTATAKGSCNISNTGSQNIIVIKNCGIGAEQADKILLLLRAVMAKRDFNLVNAKLDELISLAEKPALAQTCEGSNCFQGTNNGMVQQNEFGPPPAKLAYTEEILAPVQPSANGQEQMKVHIHTETPIRGAMIGVIFSGPEIMTREFWQAHGPQLIGSGAQQIDIKIPLSNNGMAVPNSIGMIINIPSVFAPSQELDLTVQSSEDVHVLQVVELR